MGLINETASHYYNKTQGQLATVTGAQTITLTFDPLPAAKADIRVYIDGVELSTSFYSYASPVISISSTVASGSNMEVVAVFKKTGTYQYISIKDIVNNFMIAYVGNDKLIDNCKRSDVLFHCKRGIQEFTYDIARVEKHQEIELGLTLKMPMPQDYVDYVELSWIDSNGAKHKIHPYNNTVRPSESPLQDGNYEYIFDNAGDLLTGESITSSRFDAASSRTVNPNTGEYDVDIYSIGSSRFGLDPTTINKSEIFVINELEGTISFSSNLAGQVIVLTYVSDGLGTDDEMKVHKFIEEAIYSHIAYNILAAKINVPEYVVNRFRKQRRAHIHNAKIRLQDFSPSRMIDAFRGKSKFIKH